jgi:cytochrome c-type biogenesis protein CcmH/NrfG
VGLIAALVFGLHPVHIEAVAWISAVNEPLMSIFFLLSLLCYSSQMIKETGTVDPIVASGTRRCSRKWMALSLVCYALALLTKETALVLPVIIFSFGVFFPKTESLETRPLSRRLRYAALSAIPYLLLSGVYLAVRIAALGAVAPTIKNVSVSTVLYSIPSILLFYARMLVWPVGVSMYSDRAPVIVPGLWNFFVPLAAVLVMAGVVYLLYRRWQNEGVRRLFLFSMIWIIVPLLPAMNLSGYYTTEIGHDRYLYLASFGFSLIAALIVRRLPSTRAKLLGYPALQAAVVLILIISLGIGTALQHSFWKDDVTFYSHGVRIAPNNPFARTGLADTMYGRQRFSEAGEQYEQVIALDPRQWHSQYRLGLIYNRFGHPQEAEQCFRRAIAINTNSASVHLYLGLALYDLGQIDQSIDELRQALEINADTPNAHYGIGIGLRRQGDLLGALREFRAELEKSPEHPEAKKQIASIDEKLK